MEKDSNGKLLLTFLERICGSLFKYRENVLQETANINMVKNINAAPTVTRRGGKLGFKSSTKIIDFRDVCTNKTVCTKLFFLIVFSNCKLLYSLIPS